MPSLILVRHGRPAWDTKTPIPGYALAAWRDASDAAPIDPACPPTAELLRLARSSDLLLASTLHRSIASARLLAPDSTPLVDPVFRELELPTAISSGIRLRPKRWSTLVRIAWCCGWSPGVESLAEARQRAGSAAATLVGLAATHQSVLLAGHGLMNALIAARLRRAGWTGPRIPSRRNWEFGIYDLPVSSTAVQERPAPTPAH